MVALKVLAEAVPFTFSEVSVPRLVILVCAAVVSVPLSVVALKVLAEAVPFTFSEVSVPRLVIAGCAAAVTVSAVFAVVAVLAFPESEPEKTVAVIVPAEKFPEASLLIMVLAVFTFVAAIAKPVAVATFAAVAPPTVTTDGEVAVPERSPVNCTIPFVLLLASGKALVTAFATNAVVAILVELSPAVAVTPVVPDGKVTLPVMEGDAMTGDVRVLLVKVSVPFKVAKVPLVGKVRWVVPFAVKVVTKEPTVTRLPPSVIVLPALETPVPPFSPETGTATLPAEVTQLTVVPSVCKNLPALPVCDGNKALNPADAVDAPVPPFATESGSSLIDNFCKRAAITFAFVEISVVSIFSVPKVVIGPPVSVLSVVILVTLPKPDPDALIAPLASIKILLPIFTPPSVVADAVGR